MNKEKRQRKNLVRNRSQDVGQFGDGGILAEDGDGVADFHVETGDVQHAHVHADVADGGGAVAVHAERGVAAAEVAVDAVGITHGDGGDDGARGGLAPSTVTDGVTLAQVLDLQDFALQGSDGSELDAREGADAVDADAQAHHVVLALREALDAGGVEDMAQRLIPDTVDDGPRVPLEEVELGLGEGILLRILRDAEVGEEGLDLDLRMGVEVLDEGGDFRGHETQPVHAGVQFDVDGVIA